METSTCLNAHLPPITGFRDPPPPRRCISFPPWLDAAPLPYVLCCYRVLQCSEVELPGCLFECDSVQFLVAIQRTTLLCQHSEAAEQQSAVLSLPLSRFGAVQMDGRTDGQQQAPSTSWGQTQHRAWPALLFDLARGVTHCLNPLLVLSATLVFHESRLGSPRRGREAFGFGGLQLQGRVAWCCRAPAQSTAPWLLPLRCFPARRGAGCLPTPCPARGDAAQLRSDFFKDF